ncbi:hypothetical protein Dda_8641 [Drechslerella dactyloides]|uniref:Secreted protein n=1 Tax=Drechslerella dactyloides TaxID=74499 RepID=A0AAD6IRV3_DREDA|nr:hypothetical protein Dda_8641 [Drechslerella dactyloides]
MKPLDRTAFIVAIYSVCGLAARVDIQWGTANPLTSDLRSFLPESEFWNKNPNGPRFQQSFNINTDRTHNRMKKACKKIAQPWDSVKDRETRDYLRRQAYVKAVRITQSPPPEPVNAQTPIPHPYPRPVRGIAFFSNNICDGEPKLIIWPKLTADMDYATSKRFALAQQGNVLEGTYYKWDQTFEFADFDIKKDPYSHYNRARPEVWQYMNPESDPNEVMAFMERYQERVYLTRGTVGSPIGSPYHQPFGSFREIFATRSDAIWRQVVSPTAPDYSYWDIPMINVQLDHRNGGGEQKVDPFTSFVPYGLLESSRATVFEVIEREYARFYKLMVDLLGIPGRSPTKRLSWRTKRQAAALNQIAPYLDPVTYVPLYQQALQVPLQRRKDFLRDPDVWSLQPWQMYTTSPDVPDPREWTLPPSWLKSPVWNPRIREVRNERGQVGTVAGYQMQRNPNRVIYSSVQINYDPKGEFTVQTVPVVSNPVLALEKEAVVLLEQLPETQWVEEGPGGTIVQPDYARPQSLGPSGQLYQGSAVGGGTLEQFTTATRPRSGRVQYMQRPQPGVSRPPQDERSQAVIEAPIQNVNVNVNQPEGIDIEEEPVIENRPRASGQYIRRPSFEESNDRERTYTTLTRPLQNNNAGRPQLQINTGVDIQNGQRPEAMEAEVSSPLGVGSDSRGSSIENLLIEEEPPSLEGTAAGLSSLAQSVVDEADAAVRLREEAIRNGIRIPGSEMEVEPPIGFGDLVESMQITRPRRTSQRLQIQSLPGSQVSYRPSLEALETTNALLQSGRIPRGRELNAVRQTAANYRPPQLQNLREDILAASQALNRNGDIVVPVGEDADRLQESIVINVRPRAAGPGGNANQQPAASRSSGTGKKRLCIPRDPGPFQEGTCHGLVCCRS